eukprot:NODE_8146_length_1519_cov_6.000718.p4 GENE.NODE_8146_length_1519_cov_6.000718~~NODE_8146_length_1519_cov_6.000718.p4  ORF type:complete len:72 (-),score=12.49 NODE_8146_length_1519_cov_6.000718:72-287(-)
MATVVIVMTMTLSLAHCCYLQVCDSIFNGGAVFALCDPRAVRAALRKSRAAPRSAVVECRLQAPCRHENTG